MQIDEYIALSRKYRPMTFDDVTGHETVITILKNQINAKKLAHGYLFTGLHGTGKTTLARIFAKSLNCDNPKNGNPCNKCKSCIEITNSSSLDVLEIDGASNRGIDDIRNINETVGYATFQGKYKIYIIDEVHMLTKEAFNALLKTLEEPPSNTKFFLATTEAHKIPATILSRCQRIDLRRINLLQIKEKLSYITKKISAKIEDDALSLIARLAEGSMRDAESLLENIIAYNKEGITAKDVYSILGICSKDLLFTLDKAFASNDQSAAFSLAPELFSTHTNLTSLIDQLSIHFKHHAQSILNHETEEMSLFTEEEKKGYKKGKTIYSIDQVMEILHILADTYHYNFSPISKQIHVEMLLQKIFSCKHAKSAQAILSHLKEIKNQTGTIQQPPIKSVQTIVKDTKETAEKTIAQETVKVTKETTAEPIQQKTVQTEKKVATIPASQQETNIEQKKTDTQELHIDTQEQNRQDTILQFAAVELDGKLKKN